MIFQMISSGGTVFIVLSATKVFTTGVWYHFAAVRDSTSARLYIDGNLESTDSSGFGGTASDSSNDLMIGGMWNNGASGVHDDANEDPLNGYFDEILIINGTAKYTANFTPNGVAYHSTCFD